MTSFKPAHQLEPGDLVRRDDGGSLNPGPFRQITHLAGAGAYHPWRGRTLTENECVIYFTDGKALANTDTLFEVKDR